MVLIETVGVGQSEYAVADLVDMFVLLVAPGGGDDLQGIKKGIVEMADLLVVTKDDGDLQPAAARAFQDYRAALHLVSPGDADWTPSVVRCSAHTGTGMAEIWAKIEEFTALKTASGALHDTRADQATHWMWEEATATVLADLRADHINAADLEAAVRAGTCTPRDAAQTLISAWRAKSST